MKKYCSFFLVILLLSGHAFASPIQRTTYSTSINSVTAGFAVNQVSAAFYGPGEIFGYSGFGEVLDQSLGNLQIDAEIDAQLLIDNAVGNSLPTPEIRLTSSVRIADTNFEFEVIAPFQTTSGYEPGFQFTLASLVRIINPPAAQRVDINGQNFDVTLSLRDFGFGDPIGDFAPPDYIGTLSLGLYARTVNASEPETLALLLGAFGLLVLRRSKSNC